jgi:hypothetical protein
MTAAKKDLQSKAIELRKQGKSLNDIVREIGCAKSSASVWTRHVVLNEKQRENLKRISGRSGSLKNSQVARERRLGYQMAGREKAKENNQLHFTGCMLYWVEGCRAKNVAMLANTDVDMLKIWVRFLKECYGVPEDRMFIKWTAHTDIRTPDEIEDFWTTNLGLKNARINKPEYNPPPRSRNINSTTRKGKRPYGVCKVGIADTSVVQSIYGAIQEYTGINRPKWVDGEY